MCRPGQVIVISIDGFRPAAYVDRAAAHVNMPNLRALRQRGSPADRMIGMFPTVTYPSHTTLVTGTTGFIAAGPAFQSNYRFAIIRMIDVAPTLSKVLNVPLPDAEGDAISGILRGNGKP